MVEYSRPSQFNQPLAGAPKLFELDLPGEVVATIVCDEAS